MQDKLNTLEEMVAHQDRQIQDLNDVVTNQWAEIDALKRKLERLGAKMQEIEVAAKDVEELSVTEQAALNKPPHY